MPITLTFKTSNYLAWYSYLLQYLTTPDNNLVNNSDYVLLPPNAGTYTVTLTVLNAYSFTFSKAITQISSEVA